MKTVSLTLLACPFCATVPELLPAMHHGFFVECENPACVIRPETRPCDTPEQAAAQWNARPVAQEAISQPA